MALSKRLQPNDAESIDRKPTPHTTGLAASGTTVSTVNGHVRRLRKQASPTQKAAIKTRKGARELPLPQVQAKGSWEVPRKILHYSIGEWAFALSDGVAGGLFFFIVIHYRFKKLTVLSAPTPPSIVLTVHVHVHSPPLFRFRCLVSLYPRRWPSNHLPLALALLCHRYRCRSAPVLLSAIQ